MVDYSKGRREEELEPFFPNEILRHTLLTFLLISAVILGVIFMPESFQKSTDEFTPLEKAVDEVGGRNRTNADDGIKPSSHPIRENSLTGFAVLQTRPLWYLLPFYQVFDLIKSKAAYLAILTIFAITFISVPFLDRDSERSLWKKPVFLSIVIINLLMIFALGIIKYFNLN